MRNILICLALLISNSAVANDFNKYRESCISEDIIVTNPKDFNITEKNTSTNWNLEINSSYNTPYAPPHPIGWIYPIALESNDGNCTILYPFIIPGAPETDGPWVGMGNIIADEIQAAHNDPDYDISKDVRIIAHGDMSKYAMADTVAIYPLKLQEPFNGKYNNCWGVYLRKYAHPAMLFKILLTDDAVPRKDYYINELLDNIKYGDITRPDGVAMEKSRFNCGILQQTLKNYWKPGIINE